MKTELPYGKIFYNTVTQYGSRVISVILSLISVGLLTRYLNTDKYGLFTLVFTYISFFTVLSDIGYNQTIVREFSQNNIQTERSYATYLNLKLLLIIISIILSIMWGFLDSHSNSFKSVFYIGLLGVSLGNLSSYGTSVLQSRLKLDYVAYLDIITKFATVAAIALAIKMRLDFYWIVASISIGNFVGLVPTLYLIRKELVLKFVFDLNLAINILKISVPVGITAFLSIIYFKVDTIMLSVLKSSNDVGIYTLAYKVLENILMLWGLFMANIFPLLSKYYGKSEHRNYNDLLRKTLIISIVFSTLILFFGNIYSNLIMRLLGGSKFFSSTIPLKILLFALPTLFINNIFYNIIVSFGKTYFLIVALVIALAINVILNMILIPKFGYIGASFTTVITEVVTCVAYIVIFKLKFKAESKYLLW